MASNLLELTAEIVIAHASVTEMSSNELLTEIKMVYTTLEGLEKGEKMPSRELKKQAKKTQEPAATTKAMTEEIPVIPQAPAMTIEEAFKPDQVGCMICGKTGMTTLKRHLATAHGLKPGKYRKQFNIPKDQPLAATEYVAKRRQFALDRGLGVKLVLARAARKAKQTEK
jgi:predicted transcriptional regulator